MLSLGFCGDDPALLIFVQLLWSMSEIYRTNDCLISTRHAKVAGKVVFFSQWSCWLWFIFGRLDGYKIVTFAICGEKGLHEHLTSQFAWISICLHFFRSSVLKGATVVWEVVTLIASITNRAIKWLHAICIRTLQVGLVLFYGFNLISRIN